MSIIYQYEAKVVLKVSRNIIVEEFLNYEHMKEWQPTLKEVKLVKGKWQEEGHIVHLVYLGKNKQEMIMEEKIESLSLPHKIINTYTVGSVFNTNTSYFQSFGADTMWTMEVEFHFEEEPNGTKDMFQRQTDRSMREFKRYIENL